MVWTRYDTLSDEELEKGREWRIKKCGRDDFEYLKKKFWYYMEEKRDG